MAKNHPLIKDVKNWILDSFSFMDAIGYGIEFDDEEIKNTNIIVADIDGLTDSDFEKGKKNLLKSIPNKIKAEFSYLRIRSSKDGDYFIMYIVLADNDDYFKTKNIPYINLNESKESTRKSIKESKIMSYKDFQDVCIEESENDIINFHEYKGAYFVILRTEEECERLLRVLRDKYRFEGTCYKIIDPYNPNYKCYEIMCV